jgi:membrane-associated phospholipid phosphatase
MATSAYRLLAAAAVVLLATPLQAQPDPSRPGLPSMPLFPQLESRIEWPVTFVADLDASVPPPAEQPPTSRHMGIKAMARNLASDLKHLPSRENLLWAGMGAGLALATHPFDDNLNSNLVGNVFAERTFKPGAILGSLSTLMGSAVTVYVVGRVKDEPTVSHVGADLIQALVLSEGLTQGLKRIARRERPDGSGRNSFPSGHAADTFAIAAALERHLGRRFSIPAYVFASYVAVSRLPANRHWLSDAAFGAAVGIIAGRSVTREDAQKFPVALAFIQGGIAITVVRRTK